jgi:hypothetical protein
MKNKNEHLQLSSGHFYDESPDGKEESRNRSEMNNYDRYVEDEDFDEDEITEDSFDEDCEENKMNFYNSSSLE